MSIKLIFKNHLNFESDIKKLIQYGLEIVNDNSPHIVEKKPKKEKILLLEALLLKTCALWESFIEKEIVYIINLNPENFKIILGLPHNTKLNIKLIKAIFYGDRYYDCHDIEQTKGYLKKILHNSCNPFKNISKEHTQKINFVYKMRNYLSHYSDYSRNKLIDAYKNDYDYKRFLEPGEFLYKEKGKYFENLVHNFVLVSLSMKKIFNTNK